MERLAINPPCSGLVSGADIGFALEVNGSGESDVSREIILSTGLNCLRNSRATTVRRMHKRQELDLYLTELAHVGGNLTKAARRLGINRSTLHMRIKRLEMKLASLPQAE
jgi:DNA-binding NtrC family response regulator